MKKRKYTETLTIYLKNNSKIEITQQEDYVINESPNGMFNIKMLPGTNKFIGINSEIINVDEVLAMHAEYKENEQEDPDDGNEKDTDQ